MKCKWSGLGLSDLQSLSLPPYQGHTGNLQSPYAARMRPAALPRLQIHSLLEVIPCKPKLCKMKLTHLPIVSDSFQTVYNILAEEFQSNSLFQIFDDNAAYLEGFVSWIFLSIVSKEVISGYRADVECAISSS